MKSKIEFAGFDYKQGLRYIVLNQHLTGDLKNLRKILPWRRKCGGTEPKMTGAMGTKMEDNPEEQWVFREKDLTPEEKKRSNCTMYRNWS